jgi:hypothetical protein
MSTTKAKKKRVPKYIQVEIDKMHLELARKIQAGRREKFEAVLKKEKFETVGDLFDFIGGLTPTQIKVITARYVMEHSYQSPSALREGLKNKKEKVHEG